MDRLNSDEKKIVHYGFEIGLIIKAFNGIWESVVGFLFLYFPLIIGRAVKFLIRGEIGESPQDFIVSWIIKLSNYSVSSIRVLIGVYLFVIGVAKLLFVFALYKKKLKAYIVYEWILAAFVVYQSYRYVIRHEVFVLLLTLIDIFVMVFIWLEYLRLKRKI